MAINSVQLRTYRNRYLAERNAVVIEHLPQIKYIAQRIAFRLPTDVQLDDLISAGVLGLLDAYEKFDEDKGVQFKTYAEVRIRGAILDSLRGLDWAPRSLRKKSREIERAYRQLEQHLGRSATDEEVAKVLGIDLESFHALLDQLNGLMIGHFQLNDGEEDGMDEDSLPVSYSPITQADSPFDAVRKEEIRGLLADFLRQVPEREQLIVSFYYYEELTMKEIGEILGVNESRVSQLHTRAMLRLRGKLQAALKEQGDISL